MERDPQDIKKYSLHWHHQIKHDLKAIPKHVVKAIIDHANHILTTVPHLAGETVKDTENVLRKLPHGSYRIIYIVISHQQKVWILAIEHRKSVYRRDQLEALLRLAIAIQKQR